MNKILYNLSFILIAFHGTIKCHEFENAIIDNGTIEISYVDVGKDDAEAEAINDRMNVFRALQKELNIIPDVTIRHAGDPMNEYRDFPAICDGVFPYLFLRGYPYPKTPSKEQIMHMFNQASNDFSDDPIFQYYLKSG